MKKHIVNYLLFFASAFILCTCKDPVFHAISEEVRPIEPRIKGVPTNFVIFDGRMYVASGDTVFSYNNNAGKIYWDTEVQPGGNIVQIASTGGNLYALCTTNRNNDGKTVLKRFDKANSKWNTLSGIEDYSKVHNIFAAGDKMFIMATSHTTTANAIHFIILYIDNNNPETINILKTVNPDHQYNMGEINGAAYNGKDNLYFISTKDKGVYRIDDINVGASLIESNIRFSGIINLQDDNDTILLISRYGGEVYTVKDSITKVEFVSMNRMTTGALAVWRENDLPGSGRLLLAGRQDSLSYSTYSTTFGYMELELDENGIKSGSNFVEPGINLLSSVNKGGNERYQSTIGRNPINHLFQVPSYIDSNMILFAATQKNGVWSYRDRKGVFQWNAEGADEPNYPEPEPEPEP